MADREKLIELLDYKVFDDWYSNDEIADYLIANGVTIQKWIPFDEEKPQNGQSVLGITTEGEMEVYQFDADWETCLCQFGGNVKVFNITRWMPLPEAPKGE